MAEELWKARLQARMLELHHNMKSLSLAAGLGETGVRDMLKRTQSPSIDLMAKVAKVLGMSLSELWEGPTAGELSVVKVVGETGTSGSTWFALQHEEIIILNKLGHRVDVGTSPDMALYDHRDILIYEKVPFQLLDTHQSNKLLLMTKAGTRVVGIMERKTGPERLALTTPDGEVTFKEREIAWLAKWTRSLPRSM